MLRTQEEIIEELQEVMREGNELFEIATSQSDKEELELLEWKAQMLVEDLTGEKWNFGV